MLSNKNHLSLIACAAIGMNMLSPTIVHAISNTAPILQTIDVQSPWDNQIKQKYFPYNVPVATTYRGEASWYGPGFNGGITANGETFREHLLTAAHPFLPFGTRIRVTNVFNGRSVVVRVNDRGPYYGGRILDVSRRAANVLGFSGVTTVKIKVIN